VTPSDSSRLCGNTGRREDRLVQRIKCAEWRVDTNDPNEDDRLVT
jgi:hypothetical protein